MKCPTCKGDRQLFGIACGGKAGCRPIETKCFTCSGSGEITEQQAGWIRAGKALREDRRKRGLTLRDEAKRRGISAVELSQMECGVKEPKA